MKTLQFVFILSVATLTTTANAQEFAPIGAVWYYSEGFAFSGNIDYLMITSVKDSVIKGVNCQQLHCDPLCGSPCGDQFIFQSNDSLFHYNSALDTFELISCFNVTPGDSWNLLSLDVDETVDTTAVTVDSITTELINAHSLRQLYLTYHVKDYNSDGVKQQDFSYSSRSLERIGDVGYFFNFPLQSSVMCDDNYSGGLRCYEDSFLGHYSTGIADSCTYTLRGTAVETAQQNEFFRVYPNPATDWVEISSNTLSEVSVAVIDFSGRPVLSGTWNTNRPIDVSSLPSGLYFIKITGPDAWIVHRMIKN